MNKLLVTSVSLAVLGVLWWGMNHYTVPIAQSPEQPVHREEKAEAPNLPKPPSFVERVLKDNPHITQETAEAFEQERVQINIAHQEHRMEVLREKNIENPEEMIILEQKLVSELQAQFEQLEEKYNIHMQQGKPGFVGAPIPPTLPN